ncbi:40S ribosomal protein S26 [Gracilaria domingensis]|nr:40S ribosomal protein S26 [Gracilaria domingensis]
MSRGNTLGSHNLGPRANSLPMHGAGDAIVELDIELGELIIIDDASVVEIAKRRLVHDVTNGETLDGLVLGRLAATAVAVDETGVIAAMTVPAVISALHGHFCCGRIASSKT